MINELKILFENITHFRQLINEGVGESKFIDAINNHKIVHIYYAGDDTIMKGYRTVKPMVLGYSKSKEAQENPYMLLRAWETAGSSDSKKKYPNNKGKYEYGWRLFRVDKITSFLPTGEHFKTDAKHFPDILSYNPNDSQMQNIVAAVQVNTDQPQMNVKGNVTKQKVVPEKPSAFDAQTNKFKRFSNLAKREREITADEVEHLWGMVNQMRSRGSRQDYWVVQDEHGDMILKTKNQLPNINPDSVVGNLKDLYVRLVQPSQKADNSFFKKVENETINAHNQNNQQNNLSEKKTFFK